jgi:Ca-activated chloride channel homolog
MSFEAPWASWLALALPAILMLWLLRPRRTRLRSPSLLLWRGAEVERHSARPWQRLRNHPLLWLQLLVAGLLVAAALRPFLDAPSQSRQVVLLLDASGSMRATDVTPDRFSAARQRAINIARSLGPGQGVSLIRLDEAPRVLAASIRAEAVGRLLAEQEAGYGSADLKAALALAEGVAPGSAEWVLVTDGGLEAPGDVRLPAETKLRTIVVAPEGTPGNVALTGMRVRVEGDRVSVQATLHNTGAGAASGRLVLAAEDKLVGAQDWSLAAGEERYLSWSGLPAEGRWFELRLTDVSSGANVLTTDDRAWAAAPVDATRRLLLVSGGNTFLERAFAVLGGVRTDRVAVDGWHAVALVESYDVVVFDGVWPTPVPRGNLLLVGHPDAPRFRPDDLSFNTSHPLLRHVDWSDVSIGTARRLTLDASWDVVIDSAGGPILAIREAGGRREAALAFSLSESDLPLRPAFPVLMANLIEWLAPVAAGEAVIAQPGEAVRIDPAPLVETIAVEQGGKLLQELAPPWPPAAFRANQPGVYEIVQTGGAGRGQRLLIASGYSPSEATLAPQPLSIEGSESGSTSSLPAAARALWPLLAGAVIAVSLVEWWVDARGR